MRKTKFHKTKIGGESLKELFGFRVKMKPLWRRKQSVLPASNVSLQWRIPAPASSSQLFICYIKTQFETRITFDYFAYLTVGISPKLTLFVSPIVL